MTALNKDINYEQKTMSNSETRSALKARSTQFALTFGNARKPKVPESKNVGPTTLRTIDLFCGAGKPSYHDRLGEVAVGSRRGRRYEA